VTDSCRRPQLFNDFALALWGPPGRDEPDGISPAELAELANEGLCGTNHKKI
jgi:hypothetical protein